MIATRYKTMNGKGVMPHAYAIDVFNFMGLSG
jgi:hypothetical protein